MRTPLLLLLLVPFLAPVAAHDGEWVNIATGTSGDATNCLLN